MNNDTLSSLDGGATSNGVALGDPPVKQPPTPGVIHLDALPMHEAEPVPADGGFDGWIVS